MHTLTPGHFPFQHVKVAAAFGSELRCQGLVRRRIVLGGCQCSPQAGNSITLKVLQKQIFFVRGCRFFLLRKLRVSCEDLAVLSFCKVVR